MLPLPLTPEPAEGEFDWGLTGGGGVGVEPGAGPIGGCSCNKGPGAGPGVKGTRPYKRDISFNGVKRLSMPARLNMRSAGK